MTKLVENLSLRIETGFFPSADAKTIPSSISQADGISETKVVPIDGVLNSDKGSVLLHLMMILIVLL